jgi:hypothetical protein
MIVFGICFVLWSRLRPVVVVPTAARGQEGDDVSGDRPPPH